MAAYIDSEVQKFLRNDRLTEDNLKKLDERILKECELRDKKDAILDDRKSQRSGSQRPASTGSKHGLDIDAKSVASSRMSGASKLSKTSKVKDGHKSEKAFDQMSMRSSQVAQTEVYSEINEDDEWTAIQKFNTLLHYEE